MTHSTTIIAAGRPAHKGAALIFAMIILGITTVIALGLATSSTIGVQSASVTDDSTVAFQMADSGAERSFLKLLKLDTRVEKIQEIGPCDAGTKKVSISPVSGGRYELQFFTENGIDPLSCDADTLQIRKGQSTGYFGKAVRKIEFSIPEVYDPDLIGRWDFDDDTTDSSGNNTDGELVGSATYDSDHKVGTRSLLLDGNDDFFRIRLNTADKKNLFKVSKVTVTGWIKVTGNSGDGDAWFGFLNKGPRATDGWASLTLMNTSGGYRVMADRRDPPSYGNTYDYHTPEQTSDGIFVAKDRWYFVAVVMNGNTPETWDLYVIDDAGSLTKKTRSSNGNTNNGDGTVGFESNDDNIYVGTSDCAACGGNDSGGSGSYDGYFRGLVDDVRVYKKAMPEADVQKLYDRYR